MRLKQVASLINAIDVGDLQSCIEGSRATGNFLLKKNEVEGFLKLKVGGLGDGDWDEVKATILSLL